MTYLNSRKYCAVPVLVVEYGLDTTGPGTLLQGPVGELAC
jgi:hypothetical protein